MAPAGESIFKAGSDFGFGTLAVHAGAAVDPTTGAVIEPISLSTTFAQTGVGKPIGAYEYSRSNNPNRENFEKAVAALEGAKYALAFSSGSATTAVILQSLGPGRAHVVSSADVYGGTHRYFTQVASAHNVDVSFSTSLDTELEQMITKDTRLVWLETPSNPTLSVIDIAKVVEVARAAEKKHGSRIIVVVDNTFMSPYVQQPLSHGADVVMHSVTKYINGHSDVVMGVLATSHDDLRDRLAFLQNAIGAVPSAFDSWLAHRGLKTLHLRAQQASRNAQAIAEFLAQSEFIEGGKESVNYPGLDSHRQRAVAKKQHRDGLGGGMLSFRIKGGAAAAEKFCQNTKLFLLAESLGGIESLCEVPAAMTHQGIPKEVRQKSGVFDDLVRLSCGIEETKDLLEDVKKAIEAAVKA